VYGIHIPTNIKKKWIEMVQRQVARYTINNYNTSSVNTL
jgi:hypothetical protein